MDNLQEKNNNDETQDSEKEEFSSSNSSKAKEIEDLNFYLMNSYNPNKLNTSMPVDVNFNNNDSHTLFQEPEPNEIPAPNNEKLGKIATFTGSFAKQNEILQFAEYLKRKKAESTFQFEEVDPNWKASDHPEAFIGIDDNYKGYLLEATNQQELIRRQFYIYDLQEYNHKLDNGNLFFQMMGGGIGWAASPSAFLMFGTAAKYAKLSESFINNAERAFPGIVLSSIAHEGITEATKVGGTLHDMAIDSFADIVLSAGLVGAGGVFSHSVEAGKVANAKGVIQMQNKGIEPRPIVNAKGEKVGWKATPIDNSVSAAEVEKAQQYLDSSMAKNSLYSIPWIGDKIGYAAGEAGSYLAGKVNPLIRMMHSPYGIIRALINNTGDHGIETEGVRQGRPTDDSVELLMAEIDGSNTKLMTDYNGLYLQHNGINYNEDTFGSRTKANVIGKIDKTLSKVQDTEEQFGRKVQYVLTSLIPSKDAKVNEAAAMLRPAMDDMWKEHLKLTTNSEKIYPPKTSQGYASRVYNTARMDLNEDLWMEDFTQELAKYDNEIDELNAPHKQAKEAYNKAKLEHEELIKKQNVSNKEIAKSVKNVEAYKLVKKKALEDLQNSLRDNPDNDIHIVDRNALSAKEAIKVKSITKTLRKHQKELDKTKEYLSKLKHKIFILESKMNVSKDKKTIENFLKTLNPLKDELENVKKDLRINRDKRDIEEQKLQEKMHNGQIDNALFTQIPDSYVYKLKDPKDRLKLRKTYESEHARKIAAKAYYDSILNQNAEDNIRNIMDRWHGNVNTNPTLERTLMMREKFLLDKQWLHPDPLINVMNYRRYVGRRNAIKKMLNRITVNGDLESLIKIFYKQHDERKAEVSKDYLNVKQKAKELDAITDKSSKQIEDLKVLNKEVEKQKNKLDKNLKKIGKEFRTNKKDLENTINKMQNKSSHSQDAREFTTLLNTYAAATKLGFMGLTMSTDNMAATFKFGLWPYIHAGLIPMLRTIGGTLKTAEGKNVRENAAHAYLAIQHVNRAISDRKWTGTTQTYDPVQGKLKTGLQTVAHYSNNISLANYIQNFNEMFVAQMIQSKVMKNMMEFLDGTLAKNDLTDLLKYGLDPKVYAKRFVDEWTKRGSDGSGFGSYQSHYWEWEDKEAATRMSRTIMRGVRDTVIRKGWFDAPFGLNNPIVNSIFLFMGYTFASVTRYLVPLMQTPDAKKLVGTMLMMAAGATQNPLRRIVSGQDPQQEYDHMFRNALRDSGVFSIFGAAYQDFNFLTQGLFQKKLTNERYTGRTELGVFNGPVGSMASDIIRIVGMFNSGEWNQNDIKRIAINIPALYSWEFRGLINKALRESNLPETRAKARQKQELNN